jgi:hypothetical protein
MVVIRTRCWAVLIDANGEVVKHWRTNPCMYWDHAQLLSDGRLAAPHFERPLQLFDWNGTPVSTLLSRTHHDVEEQEDGSLLVLSFREVVSERHEALSKEKPTQTVRDDLIVELSASGEKLDEVSMFSVLESNPSEHILAPVAPTERDGNRFLDLFHTNSIHRMRPIDGRTNPIYSTENVLFTARHQHVVGVFDWRTRKLLWAWGPGQIEGPHDPTLLDNGNILLFDNGITRKWSRVIELDPETEQIVWQYDGRPDHMFYTLGRGSAQRLPNGNTLFASSDEGHAVEVTRDGAIVWEYWVPIINAKGRRATLGRATRYPAAMIDAFRNRDAPPTL